jgi:nucleoside-diphosphate-sugar epimerase
MKVIFLDFNGIVDTYEEMDEINLDNLNRLIELCRLTDSKVVYSSSNRLSRFGRELVLKMIEQGLDIIGVTPKLDGNREEEIQTYLREHNEIINYCILDDDFDMPSMDEHLVKLPLQGPGSLGFTEEYFYKALKVLGLSEKKDLGGMSNGKN